MTDEIYEEMQSRIDQLENEIQYLNQELIEAQHEIRHAWNEGYKEGRHDAECY